MVRSSDYYIDINDIDEEFLSFLIYYGLCDIPDDYLIFEHEDKKMYVHYKSLLHNLDKAICNYFKSNYYGYKHSVDVYEKCLEISEKYSIFEKVLIDKEELKHIFKWAAIFHDISKFFGSDGKYHENASAKIASAIFSDHCNCFYIISLIANHDFIPGISSNIQDTFLNNNIIADIFRLADKIVISPERHIVRYYEIGKKLNTVFFNSKLDLDHRFNFSINHKDRDILTYFLLIFLLNSRDFLFNETREYYKEWQLNKKEAFYKIIELAYIDGLDDENISNIKEIINIFFKRFNVEISLN